ncbi:MAG TPA: hypothetical protein VFP98_06275, partial [Candidatus Polarisedimenticolia bacterium]|nr:hypothetical protein [Candidatus Polarisedimenticolia bacterium]
SGSTPAPDSTWSGWAPVVESASGTHVASPPARFVQYRVTLTGGSASPVLRQVVLSYLTRNQAPAVTLNSPATGEFWRSTKEIKWAGSDPDKDTLTYEILYSADNGKSWKRIGEQTQSPPRTDSKPAPQKQATEQPARPPAAPAVAVDPVLARFREDLAAADLTEEDRRRAMQQADEVMRQLQEESNRPPAPPPSAAPASASAEKSPPGVTRESTLRWDTTQVPDGTYLLKVIATDRVSNPSEPLTEEVISDPVVVANREPKLVCFAQSRKVGADRTAVVGGMAEARVPIQGAQYRIDGDEWVAIVPADGIWDGRVESWSLTTPALSRGKHQVEIKLVDVAGNVATQMVTVEAP